ncbi:MAG: IS5 family transposase [Deltaproteobacteria bacterium]|nr:IS5 family transposase [Deltaproteobacteria bacterium]
MSLEKWYGPSLWERAVPSNHRLRKILEEFSFLEVNEICEKYYVESHLGRTPIEPVKLFKALIVQVLEGLSDRELEEKINSDLAVKWFLGMKLEEKAPDHSTFGEFRERLGEAGLKELFHHYVKVLVKKKYVTRKVTVVDSTHILANVSKDRESPSNKGSGMTKWMKWKMDRAETMTEKEKIIEDIKCVATDRDARWGYKTKEDIFYGYKQHTGMDGESRLITEVEVTGGNASDHNHILSVMDQSAGSVVADKAYDSYMNRYLIAAEGMVCKIIPKQRKGMMPTIEKEYRNLRRGIEAVFGSLKGNLGLKKTRYRGLQRVAIQSVLTVTAWNFLRATRLCGIGFAT